MSVSTALGIGMSHPSGAMGHGRFGGPIVIEELSVVIGLIITGGSRGLRSWTIFRNVLVVSVRFSQSDSQFSTGGSVNTPAISHKEHLEDQDDAIEDE